MQEDMDAAILAAQTNGAMNQWYGPQQRGRIDPRQFINHGQRPPQQQYHPQPNYNYPTQPHYGNNEVDEYGLPRSIPAQQIQTLPMVVRGRDGKLIDLNEVLNEPVPGYQPPTSNIESYQGFNVPNYSDDDKSSKKKSGPQEHPFDIIMKEIKSLKRSVNKLIREIESSKVVNNPTNVINEASPKPTHIPERVSGSTIGDE